jgi:hypothetical protein
MLKLPKRCCGYSEKCLKVQACIAQKVLPADPGVWVGVWWGRPAAVVAACKINLRQHRHKNNLKVQV